MGLVEQMTIFFQEMFRRAARRWIGHIRVRPALRAKLFRWATSLGFDKPLLAIYKRFQATATDGIPNLAELVVKSYQAWSEHFDSPSMEIMDRLAATADSRMPVLVVARFEKASELYATCWRRDSSIASGNIGRAVFLFSSDCNMAEISKKYGRLPIGILELCLIPLPLYAASRCCILVEGGALPRPHALRIFADALRNSPSRCWLIPTRIIWMMRGSRPILGSSQSFRLSWPLKAFCLDVCSPLGWLEIWRQPVCRNCYSDSTNIAEFVRNICSC